MRSPSLFNVFMDNLEMLWLGCERVCTFVCRKCLVVGEKNLNYFQLIIECLIPPFENVVKIK